MEYKSDLKSSLLISMIVPVIYFGQSSELYWVLYILKCILVFIIIYYFIRVEYNKDYLIIKIYKYEKKYNLRLNKK